MYFCLDRMQYPCVLFLYLFFTSFGALHRICEFFYSFSSLMVIILDIGID